MALDVLANIAQLILQFALILFIPMYMILSIRDRIEFRTIFRKIIFIFFACILLSLAIYPFIASVLQYVIGLEYDIEFNLLIFDSELATYFIVLLFMFMIYLLAFNKTKE